MGSKMLRLFSLLRLCLVGASALTRGSRFSLHQHSNGTWRFSHGGAPLPFHIGLNHPHRLWEPCDAGDTECAAADARAAEVVALGAVHVQELSREDWSGLEAWAQLREMERRRVLRLVPA